jgi:hypothetical protein
MATTWITYAWADNTNGDVDFVAQELTGKGLTVKLDRWNIGAGKRLWEQIENFIQNPAECDGWILYATPNSLGSEPCKEEFAYALDRALHTRGQVFPIIGLFPASVDINLIPAAIRTRLYISLTDPDWKERIKAAVEGRALSINRPSVSPFFLKLHESQVPGTKRYAIEVRPRAGTWSPFFAGIPSREKGHVNPFIRHGPSGRIETGGVLFMSAEGVSDDGAWYVMVAQNEATPTQSYYINCEILPSKLVFGVNNGQPQYMVDKFS